jgi:hypothetical protein
MADNLLYWLVGFKLAGKSVDNALGHSGSKGLILSAGLYLLVRFFPAQMALARLAVSDFTGPGDLKSFSYTFVRLSHDEIWEKDDL